MRKHVLMLEPTGRAARSFADQDQSELSLGCVCYCYRVCVAIKLLRA